MTKEQDNKTKKWSILPEELRQKYIFVEKLGEGGYGEVYKVKDIKLDRDCALKILKVDNSQTENTPGESDKVKKRFIQEARILAHCKHPNIIYIYDMGGENDKPYLIMEYIDGLSLENLFKKKGKLTFKEILEKSTIILNALGYIHQKGLIHRDLTPKNILIAKESGRIVIIDFGIAKDLIASNLTDSQTVIGNPYYMSPEQWKKSKEVDNKADIYAYGVILFQMLTGEVPFNGTIEEILRQHLYETVPDAKNKSLDAPWGIQKILIKAMDKRPEYRYPDAQSFLDALKEVEYEDEDTLFPAIDYKLNDRYIFNGEREAGGFFSNVYRLRHRFFEDDFLLKIMDFDFTLQTIKKTARKDEDIEVAFNNIKERFIQKALFFRNLQHHPNIVQIFDLGFIPLVRKERRYEVPYLIVKKIKGPLLKDLIEKEAPLELDRILNISGNILSALRKIHESGYICWEVVPEKIIVEENSGKAILISAGLSDDKDIYTARMVSLTKAQIDMRLFDVLSHSPKEFEGKARGTAADITQFGIVLYQVLTGDTHYDRNILEVLSDESDEAILEKKNPGLPKGTAKKLIKIIRRSISNDLRSKYTKVEKIMHDLEKIKKDSLKLIKKK